MLGYLQKHSQALSEMIIPMTVYYAFKQQDAGFMTGGDPSDVSSTGWETMLASLIKADFSITGTWPMRTEGSNRA